MTAYRKQSGFTLVELLIAVALGALIVSGVSAVMGELAQTQAAIQERNRLTENGRFAMQRMVRTVRESQYLFLPLPDKPDTDWRENVREETVPASPPEGSSTK
ncbi:MAG: prepilin-type N-terminal cleavage/methylation domain-containing protein, partial [Gammaproteobacteria bacterium]|nr:prepilin-type N-terminal cleavage/methylation domain-containing protein [Gammaproteobacteria bacterium]